MFAENKEKESQNPSKQNQPCFEMEKWLMVSFKK